MPEARSYADIGAAEGDSLFAVSQSYVCPARQQVLDGRHVPLVYRPVQQGCIVRGVARVGLALRCGAVTKTKGHREPATTQTQASGGHTRTQKHAHVERKQCPGE